MTRLIHKIIYTLISIFSFFALLAVDFVSTAGSVLSVSADNTEVIDFDGTSIYDDLQDVDITQYPKNESGRHEVIRFMEYCYSARPFLAEEYGLYLYVYNPTENAVKTGSVNNVANMAVEYSANGEPTGYENVSLLCLDQTENNRFYKFKVIDSASFLSRAQTYAAAHEGKRRYDIAGVQLVYADGTVGELESKGEKVAKTYYYTGFAAGCGNDSGAESTLKCEIDDLVTLSLDVHPTYYRPEGTNGKNEYTQDSLHSVYFAVPKSVEEKYGEMSQIHAKWLSAILFPYLVTGNQDAFKVISNYLGVGIGIETDDLNYGYLGAFRIAAADTTGLLQTYSYAGFSYNRDYTPTYEEYGYEIETLYMLFNSGDEADSADTYIVPSEDILEKLKTSVNDFGGEVIEGANGVYSRKMFENVDETYTEVWLTPDDEKSLTSETISQGFWDKVFGLNGTVTTKIFDGIQAIYPVKEIDVSGNPAEIADRLYIAENDYEDFYNFYNANKNTSTVYLFRYRVSDFMTQEATLFERGSILGLESWDQVDTNAYFAQQSVDLNFDIIDVTFTKGDVDTVIGVVSDPLDIVHDGTPPVNTTSDDCTCTPIFNCDCAWDCECECWFIGCIKWRVIVGVVGVIILFPVANILTYPIRLLFRASNKVSAHERKNRNKKK